jgi:hypothetical protein
VVTNNLSPTVEELLILTFCASFSTSHIQLNKRAFAGKTAVFGFSSDAIIIMFVVFPFVSIVAAESRLFVNQKESKIRDFLLLSGCRFGSFLFATVSTSLIATLPSCVLISYDFTNEYLIGEFRLQFAFCAFSFLRAFAFAFLTLRQREDGERRRLLEREDCLCTDFDWFFAFESFLQAPELAVFDYFDRSRLSAVRLLAGPFIRVCLLPLRWTAHVAGC